MHCKKGSRICCSGNISGKDQWGTVWNLKYSQFTRKEGLCSQGVRAGEPPELAWGGPRSAVEGARAGRVPGEGGYQARAELRAWTLGATLLCHSLTPLVQGCMVHSPGPRLPPSVKPLAAHCLCQLQE